MSEQPTLKELRATQRLLQRAHDYIEVHGYNIATYGSHADGPRCVIGAVRTVAGLGCDPVHARDGMSVAHAGGGPELERALRELDSVARESISARACRDIEHEWSYASPGRFIEHLGFVKADKLLTDHGELNFALRVFRKALTSVYEQIEARAR